MSNIELFHLSGVMLEHGSVIKPGNWGRVTQQLGWNVWPNQPSPDGKQLREAQLEEARKRDFPHYPSRLNSAFCFLSYDEMLGFKQRNPSFSICVGYKVELKNPKALTAIGVINLVTPTHHIYPTYVTDWAYRYWEAVTIFDAQHWSEVAHAAIREKYRGQPLELLTYSPLIIKDTLQL